jgi:hypothetical protein
MLTTSAALAHHSVLVCLEIPQLVCGYSSGVREYTSGPWVALIAASSPGPSMAEPPPLAPADRSGSRFPIAIATRRTASALAAPPRRRCPLVIQLREMSRVDDDLTDDTRPTQGRPVVGRCWSWSHGPRARLGYLLSRRSVLEPRLGGFSPDRLNDGSA